jgi:hypothetical protein
VTCQCEADGTTHGAHLSHQSCSKAALESVYFPGLGTFHLCRMCASVLREAMPGTTTSRYLEQGGEMEFRESVDL